MEAHTSVITTSASTTASAGARTSSNLRSVTVLAKSSTTGSGSYPSGQATDTSMPHFRPPTMRELAMLLPSPTKASFSPSSRVIFSRTVIRSASTWQGWAKSVRPLTTGMGAIRAKASTSAWAKVRIMMPSQYRASTRAVSSTGSPRPIWLSLPDRNRAWPPSWYMPTSKDTRVLVEFFSKIMARVLPLRWSWAMLCFWLNFIWSAVSRISWMSSRDRSSSLSKSFFILTPPVFEPAHNTSRPPPGSQTPETQAGT